MQFRYKQPASPWNLSDLLELVAYWENRTLLDMELRVSRWTVCSVVTSLCRPNNAWAISNNRQWALIDKKVSQPWWGGADWQQQASSWWNYIASLSGAAILGSDKRGGAWTWRKIKEWLNWPNQTYYGIEERKTEIFYTCKYPTKVNRQLEIIIKEFDMLLLCYIKCLFYYLVWFHSILRRVW